MTAEERVRDLQNRRLLPQRVMDGRGNLIDAGEAFVAAIRQAVAEERERAAKVGDAEAGAYYENARACDATGNTYGGTMDTAAALGCERVAATIRAGGTPAPSPPP